MNDTALIGKAIDQLLPKVPLTSAYMCTKYNEVKEPNGAEWEGMDKAELLREKLRKAIAAKIKREGWSQSEAGRLCDTSRVHMNHLVKGTGPAALSKLIQVAEDLGLRVEFIIEDRRQEK